MSAPSVTSTTATPDELWEAVFEASRSCMVISSLDRQVLAANAATLELTGYAPDQITALHVEDLCVESFRDEYVAFWARTMSAGSLSVCGRRLLRVAGGGSIPIHFSANRIGADRVLAVYLPTPNAEPELVAAANCDGAQPTTRQRQVITLLALGLTDEQMGERLVLSPETVRTHVRNAMSLTQAHNRPHLVAQALERGWLAGTS